jgi:type IV secretory pathway VirJ component
MNKYLTIAIAFLFIVFLEDTAFSQTTNTAGSLPVNIVNSNVDTSKPFIVYITGDGGWNNFSKNLSASFAKKGYPVVALDAKKYFWDKKTPAQTAADVSKLIKQYQQLWKRKNLLLIGYSFGADIVPFVYNNLSKELSSATQNICLISPSNKTDFEIHVWVMLGGSSDGESVPAAINEITDKPITLVFGEDEDAFAIKQLTIKNYSIVKLAGGHHYDGDETNVCNNILQQVSRK